MVSLALASLVLNLGGRAPGSWPPTLGAIPCAADAAALEMPPPGVANGLALALGRAVLGIAGPPLLVSTSRWTTAVPVSGVRIAEFLDM